MATSKKEQAKKAKKSSKQKDAAVTKGNVLKKWIVSIKTRIGNLLRRRPHRSFKRTYRRDYVRSLKLPGYWAFTNEVRAVLWRHKKTFLLLVLVYGAVTAAIVGIASQETYAQYSDALRESGGKLFEGSLWEVGQAGILLTTGILGSLNEAPGDIERFVAVLLGLMVWLTTVWLLRVILAGKKPKLRDGIYNAGAPLISTFFVFLIAVIQLFPVALAAIAFTAASASGLINEGIESMIFWTFEIMLLALSMYWVTSTFFALIVVTLPGMYPLEALKAAGDLVIGRRIRILFRFIWLFALTFVVWAIIMIPTILFDNWLKSVWPAIQWLPIVPICFLVIASLSVVWISGYTYVLYRKVVDDDSAPA